MRKRNFKRRYVTETDERLFWVHTVVTEVIESNKEYPHPFKKGYCRFKNVFMCKSNDESQPDKMCVHWKRSCVEVGDKVQMLGRIENEVFLARKVIVIKPQEKGTENVSNLNDDSYNTN